jgi:pentapeptide MXKDX repeat protein
MPNKKAAWTVMVYLAGDNNLTSECLFALTEMKKALPGKHLNVIAQFDPQDDYLPTQRYEINRKGQTTTVFEDVIDEARYNPRTGEVEFMNESKHARLVAASRSRRAREVREKFADKKDLSTLAFIEENTRDDTDTGSPSTLYNFLSFCIEQYPAYHYLIVLSGHAGGIETDYLLKDESSKGSLTFNEMKEVFRQLQDDLQGQPVDILGMDNCLMSMSEICYELRGLVDIVVGCESFSPASGWPYRQILERLRDDCAGEKTTGRKSVTVKAARGIVDEYVNYYSPYWLSGMSVSQSALDITRVEELRKHVDKLAATLENELIAEFENNRRKKRKSNGASFKDCLILAHWEAQSYNGERFVDLFDFCGRLEERSHSTTVKKRCNEVRRFIQDEFVLKTSYSGAAYQYSYGVSLYFPWAQIVSTYQNLDFVRDSKGAGWFRFLQTYTQLTRRLPRGIGADEMAQMMGSSFGAGSRMGNDRMGNDRMGNDRMGNDRMGNDRMGNDRMGNDRMGNDRMGNDRMGNDRMGNDRMGNDRMMGKEGQRISSMRNPPLIFVPGGDIKHKEKSWRTTKKFFGPRRAQSNGK